MAKDSGLAPATVARRAITVRRIVQGVGFRPFVHGLASRLGLRGSVRNSTAGALIEVEGEPASLDRRRPPRSRI